MGKEYPDAVDMFVPRERTFINLLHREVASIILHGTGSPGTIVPTAQEIAHYFATNTAEVSSHFVVGRDGTVVQCVSLEDGAGANCCVEPQHSIVWDYYLKHYGNLNLVTFSIEHCNNIDNSLELTTEQKNASFKLVKWLCQRYAIPSYKIRTHASIAPVTRKLCPGNYPLGELQNYVLKG